MKSFPRNVLSDSTNAQFSEQHGLNEGRSTTDSNSDLESANHTATSGKSNNVTQDRENLVRDLGLAIAGGDAFEALRTFNSSSESRAALSALVNQNTPKYEQVLPPKAPSIGQTGKAFVAVSREDIVNDYQSSTHAVQAVSDDSVSRRRAEKDIRLPSKNEFMAQTHQERDLANFRLGLSMVASSDYLQAETGIRSVLERAFGGALTYSSPQEIYNTLNERSTNDPELKQTLTELGSVAHSEMSEDEIMNNFKNRR